MAWRGHGRGEAASMVASAVAASARGGDAAATRTATMAARVPCGCAGPERSPLVAYGVLRTVCGCCMSGRVWSRCMSGSCRCGRADVLRRPLAHRARAFFASACLACK